MIMQTIHAMFNNKPLKIKGQVYHYGKKNYAIKDTIQEYNRIESSDNEITHLSNDNKIYWLKSYGLDSWNIQI